MGISLKFSSEGERSRCKYSCFACIFVSNISFYIIIGVIEKLTRSDETNLGIKIRFILT